MKKTLTPRRAVCGLLAALAAAAAVWLLCRWVGYDLQLRLGDKQQFEIVNDDYSRIIDVPDEGLVQTFPLKAGQSICGVRLNFSTHDALYKCGMVMVDLYDENGQLLGQGAGNFLNIFNDSFTAFAYGGSYTAEKDEVLTLHIYNEVAWDGPLGLWASEGTVPGMPLYAGDTAQDATLALQIMTDRSADWPTRLAQSLAPLLAAAAFAAVLLCVWRAPAVLYLAAVGLACGLAFVRVTPALTAPDEYTHLAAAYEQASRWSGQTAADENGRLLVRACDAPYFGTRTGDIGIFAYKQAEAVIEQAQRSGPADPALTVVSEAKAGQGSGSYLPQALGIWLARARGADFYTMLRTGRICNLLLYLALAALAAALAPAGVRGLLACAALLPMPLQLAGSLSPDASVLGTVFCYTALCLRLCGKKAALWEKLLLVVLGGIVGPAKAIYLPVVLLCFVIPADNLAGPQRFVRGPFGLRVRSGRLIQAATLVLAGGLWLTANLSALAYAARDVSRAVLAAGAAALAVMLVLVLRLYAWARTDARRLCRLRRGLAAAAAAAVLGGVLALSRMGGGLDPDQLLMTNPNGDSIWTFSLGYICRNLPATAKLLLRTIPEQGALWLQGVLGTTLGEPIVYRLDVSWLLGVGLVLALLAAALPVQGEQPLLGRRAAWGTAGIILCVVAASLVVALNWTPINYQTLFGLQGRYWLPVLPLALVLCKRAGNISLRRNASRGAALAVTACTLLTLLQGFGLYASWQPVS